jgi:hypothetical protein
LQKHTLFNTSRQPDVKESQYDDLELQKRSPPDAQSMEQRFNRKKLEHLNAAYSKIFKSPMPDYEARMQIKNKWATRERIVQNNDYGGMISQARHYHDREMDTSLGNNRRRKATENKDAWLHLALAAAPSKEKFDRDTKDIKPLTWFHKRPTSKGQTSETSKKGKFDESDDDSMDWQKRSPPLGHPESMEEKFRRKTTSHVTEAGVVPTLSQHYHHLTKANKWYTRDQILESKDYQEMLKQVQHYHNRQHLSLVPRVIKEKAAKVEKDWQRNAMESAPSRYQFEQDMRPFNSWQPNRKRPSRDVDALEEIQSSKSAKKEADLMDWQ